MGIFSRKSRWSTGPIEHLPGGMRIPPCPDVWALAVEVAGPDPAEIQELANRWHRSLIGHAASNLGNVNLADRQKDFDAVVQRPDCSTELVYNFLTHLGGGGKAIAKDWQEMLHEVFIPAARAERG